MTNTPLVADYTSFPKGWQRRATQKPLLSHRKVDDHTKLACQSLSSWDPVAQLSSAAPWCYADWVSGSSLCMCRRCHGHFRRPVSITLHVCFYGSCTCHTYLGRHSTHCERHVNTVMKNEVAGAGELAQWVRILSALAKNTSAVLSTPKQHPQSSSTRRPNTLLGSSGTRHTCVHAGQNSHTHKKYFNKNKKQF